MSRKELQRPGLIKAACSGRITTRQVAQALRLSLRQVRRLKRRFEADGPGGLTHRSRGRPSGRRLPAPMREAVTELMTTRYVGFNDTMAASWPCTKASSVARRQRPPASSR